MKSVYSSRKIILPSLLLISVIIIFVAGVFFKSLRSSFETKQREDTLYHLEVLTRTLAESVKNSLLSKWNNSLAITTFCDTYTDPELDNLWRFMQDTKRNNNYSDLLVFTDDLSAYNEYGETASVPFPNDYLKVIRGTKFMYYFQDNTLYHLHYTNSKLRINGKRVFATALGYKVNSFFENLNFQPFEGASTVYILNYSGSVLGFYNSDTFKTNDNLIAALQNASIKNFSKEKLTISDYLASKKTFTGTVTFDGTNEENYVVMLPSANETINSSSYWYIYLSVPTRIVNYNTDQYSIFLTRLSGIIIVLVSIMFLLVFSIAYKTKSKKIEEKMDTTEESQNKLLKIALAMAEQSNNAKTAFLSNMSHDIRTPLNAVISMTDFALSDVNDTEKVKNYLNIIKKSSGLLLQLINNILDMSRIESGKLVLKHELFDFYSVYSEVLDVIQSQCDKKNIKLKTRFRSHTNKLVLGDNLMTKRVLLNVLSNAIKFTDNNGFIVFDVEEQKSINETLASYKISVKDNGCGIDAEMLDKIFQPFVRGNDTKTSSTEGTGLGLAITKSLVDAMNGSINVSSKKNEGTTFVIELFFQVSDVVCKKPNVEQEKTSYDFDKKKVLVVEDNEINKQIVAILLKKMNLDLDFAEDGKIAVEKFEQSENKTYSLIFMDIQMPNMNGYEATKAIRSSEHPQSKTIPIIAMTANVFDEDIEKCRKVGMNAHVGKPLDPEQLGQVTSSFLDKF